MYKDLIELGVHPGPSSSSTLPQPHIGRVSQLLFALN